MSKRPAPRRRLSERLRDAEAKQAAVKKSTRKKKEDDD